VQYLFLLVATPAVITIRLVYFIGHSTSSDVS